MSINDNLIIVMGSITILGFLFAVYINIADYVNTKKNQTKQI